jgi:hypothetical protein
MTENFVQADVAPEVTVTYPGATLKVPGEVFLGDATERLRQYRICRERGHTPDIHYDVREFEIEDIPMGIHSDPYKCKHCGTIFWYEQVLREIDPPEGA